MRLLLIRPRIFRHRRDSINLLRLHATRRATSDSDTVSIGSAIFLARHRDSIRVSLAIIPFILKSASRDAEDSMTLRFLHACRFWKRKCSVCKRCCTEGAEYLLRKDEEPHPSDAKVSIRRGRLLSNIKFYI